ncbi:MAG: hypothetical protein ACM3Q2_07090 [Syntrophothermus sp.]
MIKDNFMNDKILLTVPCDIKFNHLAGDALESYLKTKIKTECIKDLSEDLHVSRLLIYELFSNAFRHSPGDNIHIEISFEQNYLAVNIQTCGDAFTICPKDKPGTEYKFPYPESISGRNFLLYKDNEEIVNCHVMSESSLKFTKCSAPESGGERVEIPGHFGLLLLTSICSDVKYSRTNAGQNIFSVKRCFPVEALK